MNHGSNSFDHGTNSFNRGLNSLIHPLLSIIYYLSLFYTFKNLQSPTHHKLHHPHPTPQNHPGPPLPDQEDDNL